MRFEFVPCATIPRLAWCAQLRRGEDVARIYHGPWVETRDGWFVEGAWTGEFERGELDTARFNLGTGGVLRAGRAVFCTQSDMIERLYALRSEPGLYLSNSLVFLLGMTGEELDPCFPFYYYALRAYNSDGIWRKRKTIHTRSRRRVELHDHCQLAVDQDLRMERIEKPAVQRPASFEEYVALLQDVLAGVLENAAAAGRRHARYSGLATVSGGYDSNSLAVLLARLGVREAITFFDRTPGEDSGAEIARRLGLSVREYDRVAFRTAPGVDEAEFLAGARGEDVVLASCEEQLVGKVLVIGRYGDVAFSLDPEKRVSDLRTPHRHVVAGSTMLEFRLRTGFFNFNPLYTVGLHVAALHAISRSEEMKPWRVGGKYDRPIPRRLLEEAGIPRGLFGYRKAASAAVWLSSPAALSPAARADFEAYRSAMPRPGRWRRYGQQRLAKLHWRRRKWALVDSLLPAWRRYGRYNQMDFGMHWGHAKLRPRYAEAVVARARREPTAP
jgi:hypothetical protein